MGNHFRSACRRAVGRPAGTAATISVLALVPIFATASPASASVVEEKCSSYQSVDPETAGINPNVGAKICVQKDSTGVYRAEAYISWGAAGQNDFHNFDFHLRLEKYDVVKKGAVCDLTSRLNTQVNNHAVCQTTWTSVAPGGLTADATIIYDSRDISGEKKLEFTGSPSL